MFASISRRLLRLSPFAVLLLAFALVGTSPALAVDPDLQQSNLRQLDCLATAIYFEARGEPALGQVAVAQVILNRVKDARYPKSICGVVFQNSRARHRCQFSFACDGKSDVPRDQTAWERAREIAKLAASGEWPVWSIGDATLYHARYVSPGWAPKVTRVSSIGQHVFYIE